jgi:hypothetical protein
MSFWSSLSFVRTARPPVVAAAAIGDFVRDLAATGAIVGNEKSQCQIKYGSRVDIDRRPTEVIEWSGMLGTIREYPWDRSDEFTSLTAMADALATDCRKTYRAYLDLGEWHPDIVTALTREPSEDNCDPLCLHRASFSVGPVAASGLACEREEFVGWMRLTFSGPGYFFPWTQRQARERAQEVGLGRRLVEVCRAAWPVSPMPVPAAVIARRQRLGELWLYRDLDLPEDWLWFGAESG